MRDVGGREPLRPGDRRALRRLPALAGQPGRAAAARPVRGARVRGGGPREGARRARSQPAARPTAGGAGLRLRHDRAARAAARRDDARHAPAARRPAGAARPAPARGGRAARGRPRSSSPRGRSRWAPTPSRGRSTTSVPRTWSTCPPSGSTPPRSRTARTRRSSTRAATTTRAGGASAGWAHRVEAGLVAPQFWERDGDDVVAAALRRAWSPCRPPSRCATSASSRRRPTRVGGQAAAHRGGVGEGRPLRPRDGPLAALPVGRRRADARAREPRAASPAARPGGRLPGGGVAAGGAPDGRRRVGVDHLGLAPLPGLQRVPVPGVLAGVLRRRLPRAARRLVRDRRRRRSAARSATGTTRSGGRSSPASGAPGRVEPGSGPEGA